MNISNPYLFRKCKEIKSKLEKEYGNKIEIKTQAGLCDKPELNKDYLDKEKVIDINNYTNTTCEIFPSPKLFKVYGDPISGNLNLLILNNILSCQYFKESIALKTFPEVVQEIIENAFYVEAWAVGMSGVPSTLFCCLYKLMLLKLTENEVNFLKDNQNPYVRCTGFLFIRYLSDPKDLWERLSPYLDDEQGFTPRPDKKTVIKIGEFVESLLLDYNYYGTRLPRIPTTIEREIKAKMMKRKIFQKESEERVRDRSSDRTSHKKDHRRSSSRSRSRTRSRKRSRKYSRKHSRSRSNHKNREYIIII